MGVPGVGVAAGMGGWRMVMIPMVVVVMRRWGWGGIVGGGVGETIVAVVGGGYGGVGDG